MKKTLFILAVIATTMVAFTSCQTSETEDLITTPYGEDHFINDRASEENSDLRNTCGFCNHRGSSYRTSNSRYVYCYGNNGYGKTYELGIHHLNGGRIYKIGEKSTSHYNTWFGNLNPSRTYFYRVVNHCPNGDEGLYRWTRINW